MQKPTVAARGGQKALELEECTLAQSATAPDKRLGQWLSSVAPVGLFRLCPTLCQYELYDKQAARRSSTHRDVLLDQFNTFAQQYLNCLLKGYILLETE